MSDPLLDRLDQLGEQFRATGPGRAGGDPAAAPPPGAFLLAVQMKRHGRDRARRFMLGGAVLAAAACIALAFMMTSSLDRSSAPVDSRAHAPTLVAAHGAGVQSIRVIERSLAATDPVPARVPGSGFARDAGEAPLYAGTFASAARLDRLLN